MIQFFLDLCDTMRHISSTIESFLGPIMGWSLVIAVISAIFEAFEITVLALLVIFLSLIAVYLFNPGIYIILISWFLIYLLFKAKEKIEYYLDK